MFKKNDEEMIAEEARKKSAEAKETQFRKLVVDAWSSIKWEIESGRTRAIVWTFDAPGDVIIRVMKHFENMGYRVIRADDCISIDWGEKK